MGGVGGVSIYAGREYYAHGNLENVTTEGLLWSGGGGVAIGAGGVLLPGTTAVIGLGLTGWSGVDLYNRLPDFGTSSTM